ncbi:hypothetical protein BLNAU_2227 [Blattamonas nauphoetae]|uniref:HAT C-terminal dimerisation domain-containing protein n=1 Tax=Blattamonas nauphoetae TaxID=2049346 RepID=A0ABQ9YG99_9EUKA|nr:hypothetical protein BLNAU_2227 [Blattamonas nauphoetae]
MLFSAALTKLGRDSIYMNKPIVDFDIKLTEIPEPASISESESSNEIIEVTSDDDYSSSSQQSMRTKIAKRQPKSVSDQRIRKRKRQTSTQSSNAKTHTPAPSKGPLRPSLPKTTVIGQNLFSVAFHNKVHSQSINKLQDHSINSLSSSNHLFIPFPFSSQNNHQIFQRFIPHHLFILKHQVTTLFFHTFRFKLILNNTIIWNTLKTHGHHLSCAPLELLKEQFSEWLDRVESISESISSTKFTTFWGQYGRDKPAIELKELACQVGSIPCSEVECERYFSYLGMHYSPEHQSLDPEQLLAEMYVALK